MDLALGLLRDLLLGAGALLCLIGVVGVHRLPEFYSRLHAAGMIDSLGAPLILIGLMVEAGPTLLSVKLLTILAFVLLSSPANTSALAQAAFWGDVRIDRLRPERTPTPQPQPAARPDTPEA